MEHNTVTNGKRAKMLSLLGKGLPSSVVATAVGVTESYVAQILAEPDFAEEVTSLRINNLESHTKRDASYDAIEDQLLEKLNTQLFYIQKPSEILSALKVVNSATRRGVDPLTQAGSGINQSTIVNITLPSKLIAEFKSNALGQVIEAEHTALDGETTRQSLVTIPSHAVGGLVTKKELPNE